MKWLQKKAVSIWSAAILTAEIVRLRSILNSLLKKCFLGRSRTAAAKADDENQLCTVALNRLCENSVVPPGLESSFPLFPALKRRAIVSRPFGAKIIPPHCPISSSHATLKRCATQNQVQRRHRQIQPQQKSLGPKPRQVLPAPGRLESRGKPDKTTSLPPARP